MRFYFAGKITKNDWRHQVVKGLRDALYSSMTNQDVGSRFDGDYYYDTPFAKGHDYLPGNGLILLNAILGGHDYVGPFFVACDHGGFHGDSQHGVAASLSDNASCCAPGLVHPHSDLCRGSAACDYDIERGYRRNQVFERSIAAIGLADVVYCYLSDVDAFGTLVELGAAHQAGKEIWIAYSSKIPDDCWFVLQTAQGRLYKTDDPVLGFHTLYEQNQFTAQIRARAKRIV